MKPYHITEHEFLEILQLMQMKMGKMMLLISPIMILPLVFDSLSGEFSIRYLMMNLISSAFIFVCLIVFVRIFTKEAGKRQYRGSPWISGSLSIEFNEEAITLTHEKGAYRLSWSDVKKSVENERYILVYDSPQCSVMIKKSAFDSDEELAKFKKLAGL